MNWEDLEFLESGEALIECPKCHYRLLNPAIYSEASNPSEFTNKLSSHELLFHHGEDVDMLCKCYMCDNIWVIEKLLCDEEWDEDKEE